MDHSAREGATAAEVGRADPAAVYGPEYYASHCGDLPYDRTTKVWFDFYGRVADAVVRGLAPRRVFDAGCAIGFLVEALWDRGVEAHGRDVSPFAISQVRQDVRPYCAVGSIADPIEGEYDLVLCIEVLEHMPEEEALRAIGAITAAAPRILFSSSSIDLDEPTHVNVRPTIYWLRRFAEAGFAPVPTHDATYLCPHAMLLERSAEGRGDRDLAAFAEIVRQRLAVAERGRSILDLERRAAEAAAARATEAEARERAEREARAEAARRSELEARVEATRAEAQRWASVSDARAASAEARALSAEARAETAEARAEAAEARAEAAASRAGAAEAETASALDRAASAEAAGARANNQAGAAAAETASAEARALHAEARASAIETSTVWRATRPVRAVARRFPAASRFGRRALRVAWWTATLQLPRRLSERRLAAAPAAPVPVPDGPPPPVEGDTVAQHHSAPAPAPEPPRFFDADWYRENYPDVIALGFEPLQHYLRHGVREGRSPGPGFSVDWYAERYPDVAATGLDPLSHYLLHGEAEGRDPVPPPPSPLPPSPPPTPTVPSAAHAIAQHLTELEPLRTFFAPGDVERRITLITDSINAGHLFGGVGTAIVIAATLAHRTGARLRLVTRREPAEPSGFAAVLSLQGTRWTGNVEFVHSPPGGGADVPMGGDEIVLTTSWWTTWSARCAVDPRRIIYLLQEDERMFYPYGDDRLRCAETLADDRIRFVVNTEALFEHLVGGAEPLPNIRSNGTWFEPAFPAMWAQRPVGRPEKEAAKRQFFFYARPNNFRNLYWRGLEAISACLEEGVLRPEEWDLNFVGRDLQPLRLPRGVSPRLLENLPWGEYAEVVRGMDVGLSLMDTPHPSYPPLDLAAAGAAVVTNRHGPKTSLVRYSENIICADPSVEGLVRGIADAVALADDTRRRAENHARSRIGTDWNSALGPVLDRLFPTARAA